MIVASLAFALIYLLIACQGPRVWRLTSSSGLRLLGVLCVHRACQLDWGNDYTLQQAIN